MSPLSSIQMQAMAELELRRRSESGVVDASSNMPAYAYVDDPVGFIKDFIIWKPNEHPADYQNEVMTNLSKLHRESVRGPHGLGKTALIAWLILWFAETNDGLYDWKIPVTASAWRQLTKYAMPEVHKWARRLNWSKLGHEPYNDRTELTQLSLRLKTGEMFALASDNAALIEGAHADKLFYIFDESKEIPAPTWDAAEGAFSTGNCYWLAASTPGEPQGRFYDIQSKQKGYEDWHVTHITLDQVMEQKPGFDKTWPGKRKLQWGEKSAVYQNRVAGEFASSEADGVIPLAWVEAANRRWEEFNDLVDKPVLLFAAVGVDVARSGEEAIQRLNEKSYDIVLMDIQMPVMDGIEATRLIRQDPKFAELPIFAVSASVTQNVRHDCAVAGVSGFIGKPIDSVELVNKLLEFCTTTNIAVESPKVTVDEPAPSINDDVFSLEGFDSRRLAEVIELMGSKELLLEVIDSMREDFAQVVTEIKAHISQGNIKAAKVLAHKVKGASASVGAVDIYSAAQALEAKLLLGETAIVELDNLDRTLNVFLNSN